MALWGNKDSKAVTGTIAVTATSNAVVGTSTTFTTELKSGQTLFIASVEYRIDSIQDDTHLTLHKPYAGSTATGLTVTANEQPAYLRDGGRQAELDAVYGVDSGAPRYEAQLPENRAKGLKTPGWSKYRTYTDANGNVRHKAEVLVAMKTVYGDANDDSVLADD